jgi:hypothetical protein
MFERNEHRTVGQCRGYLLKSIAGYREAIAGLEKRLKKLPQRRR